MNKTLFYMNN